MSCMPSKQPQVGASRSSCSGRRRWVLATILVGALAAPGMAAAQEVPESEPDAPEEEALETV